MDDKPLLLLRLNIIHEKYPNITLVYNEDSTIEELTIQYNNGIIEIKKYEDFVNLKKALSTAFVILSLCGDSEIQNLDFDLKATEVQQISDFVPFRQFYKPPDIMMIKQQLSTCKDTFEIWKERIYMGHQTLKTINTIISTLDSYILPKQIQ